MAELTFEPMRIMLKPDFEAGLLTYFHRDRCLPLFGIADTNPTSGYSGARSVELGKIGEGGTLGKLTQMGVNPETEVESHPSIELLNGDTSRPDFRVQTSRVGFKGIIETKWTLSDSDPRALLQFDENLQISKMTGLPLYYDVYGDIPPGFRYLFDFYKVGLL